ncbi:MAG: hypothetical protein Q8J78_16360 [Moraxellaceae bacterium]|nr:hypothetical protein [Moraxellaceae bacterium]
MFDMIIFILVILAIYFGYRYIRQVGFISIIAMDQQKALGLLFEANKLTSLTLFRDVGFFISLLTRSYAKRDVPDSLLCELDIARKYLFFSLGCEILFFFSILMKRFG